MSSETSAPNGWQPKAVVFDLLTGLLDSWTLWDASTPSGSAAEGRPWREHYLKLTYEAGPYVPYEDLVTQAAIEVGLPKSAPENLIANYGSIKPWPEAAPVLKTLKERGLKLAVVTNCSKRLGYAAIDKIREQVPLDAVITAEESGWYKPVPQAYEAVLELLGLGAEEVLFVAGSAGDVIGASRVGMRVAWHNRAGMAKKGDAVPLKEGKSLDEVLQEYL